MSENRASLPERWNKAAADAGYCGSEYVDEPERVFDRVKMLQGRERELIRELVLLRRSIREREAAR